MTEHSAQGDASAVKAHAITLSDIYESPQLAASGHASQIATRGSPYDLERTCEEDRATSERGKDQLVRTSPLSSRDSEII